MKGQTISLSYASETGRSRDSISILVVDDDITCLSIVAALLKKFKYEVVTVKHPKDALCTLRIKGGAFDLVISDIHMPDMDGFELQEVITHEFNLPVVLMSGDNKEGVASKGLESGAAFFISKPVSPEDLRNLWQFAAMKKRSRVVIEEAGKEVITSDRQNSSDEIDFSASSANEGGDDKKDSKRKSLSKEGSDDRGGDTSAQSASKKKQKVIWTNALHNCFLEAIRSIGLDRSVPKKILEVMNVPGLTRENVASHLQKYRIFLRRVSDASYKIHGDDKGLSRRFASSSKPHFHNLGNFPTANTILFPNQERSPIGAVGLHQLSSITGTLLKPNFRHPKFPNLLHQNDRSASVQRVQTNYQASSLFQGHTGSFDASILGSTSIKASDFISQSASVNLADPMNYVGYKISNIKHLTESGSSTQYEGLSSCSSTANLNHNNSVTAALLSSDHILNLDVPAQFLEPSPCNVTDSSDLGQLPEVISDYQNQNLLPPSNPSLLCNMENQGLVQVSPFTPMNDLSEFDIMTTQEALGEGDPAPYFPDLGSIQNQAQQNGGETTVSSCFYDATNNWDSHFPSYDQAPNQHDDDDYLESLLAFGSFGEDGQIQTLEGI